MSVVGSNKRKRVLLGMSGGVDSSVAAIILKENGFDVIGVTLKLVDDEVEGTCCNLSSTLDAKRVCDFLDIPHYTLNFVDEFKKHVIDNFICEYSKCRTPNPCIECNKFLKFGSMYKLALELGCDFIATGHYARVIFDEKYDGKVLKRAYTSGKDQSYVLYNMPKELLNKVLFPLGDFENKSEVRKIAADYNLPVACKPDSEDICFIPDGDYKGFLEREAGFKSLVGNIVDKNGNVLGLHSGLYKYTIGQRKGIGVSSKTPLYVIGLDVLKNELIVGEENDLLTDAFEVDEINLLLDVSSNIKCKVKTRYSSPLYDANVSFYGDKANVIFDIPQKRITPGQSAVFYDGDIIIGGGKIVRKL